VSKEPKGDTLYVAPPGLKRRPSPPDRGDRLVPTYTWHWISASVAASALVGVLLPDYYRVVRRSLRGGAGSRSRSFLRLGWVADGAEDDFPNLRTALLMLALIPLGFLYAYLLKLSLIALRSGAMTRFVGTEPPVQIVTILIPILAAAALIGLLVA